MRTLTDHTPEYHTGSQLALLLPGDSTPDGAQAVVTLREVATLLWDCADYLERRQFGLPRKSAWRLADFERELAWCRERLGEITP